MAGKLLSTSRMIAATPQRIFAAFSDPKQLAQWWGPRGFKNTFEVFEFKPGGRWHFVMHGPDGRDYRNECVFRELDPSAKVVIEHVVKPIFTLTITLAARADETLLTWEQDFDSPETAAALRAVCVPANEQNLDRLEGLIAS